MADRPRTRPAQIDTFRYPDPFHYTNTENRQTSLEIREAEQASLIGGGGGWRRRKELV